jgi:lysophospholipase L1-like esterase
MNNKILLAFLIIASVMLITIRIFNFYIPHSSQVLGMLMNDIKSVGNEERNKEYRISIFEQFSPEVDIVFAGDSITQAGEWTDFFPNHKIANRGVGSDTTHDLLQRLDSIISVNPRIVFVMIGINDIVSGRPLDDILVDYYSVIQSLQQRNIQVIIQSTVQCQTFICKQHSHKVNHLNVALERFAHEHDIIFVRLEKLSKDTGLNYLFTYDGIHLNGRGYQEWVKTLLPIMENLNSLSEIDQSK